MLPNRLLALPGKLFFLNTTNNKKKNPFLPRRSGQAPRSSSCREKRRAALYLELGTAAAASAFSGDIARRQGKLEEPAGCSGWPGAAEAPGVPGSALRLWGSRCLGREEEELRGEPVTAACDRRA